MSDTPQRIIGRNPAGVITSWTVPRGVVGAPEPVEDPSQMPNVCFDKPDCETTATPDQWGSESKCIVCGASPPVDPQLVGANQQRCATCPEPNK